MRKNIGIIIELDNGKIKEANYGQITMAAKDGSIPYAIILDGDATPFKKDLESWGIANIINVRLDPGLQNNPVIKACAVIEMIKEFNLSMVFCLTTAMGKDLLPRIAALLDAPLVMDCFDVDVEKNRVKTSQYSGKTIATIQLKGDVALIGVRPNSVTPVQAPCEAQMIDFQPGNIDSKGFKVLKSSETDKSSAISLAEADVVVSGGRGMKNGDNFAMLFECAKKLNAAVGASRVAVDSGWVPYAMQVGQTGEKVSPKVYIACGISGSMQHFAGMKTSGLIIALNTDENAYIISNCDYYAVGDALEIIPELTKLL